MKNKTKRGEQQYAKSKKSAKEKEIIKKPPTQKVGGVFKFNLIDYWVPNPQSRFSNVISTVERAVNSPEFTAWFLDAKFTEIPAEYQGFSSVRLLKSILKEVGIEYYVIKKKWYQRFSSVIGFTESNVISTYSDFYFSMSDAELGGHIFHETLHVAGHSHSFNPSNSRNQSLPYQCGNWVVKNYKNYAKR